MIPKEGNYQTIFTQLHTYISLYFYFLRLWVSILQGNHLAGLHIHSSAHSYLPLTSQSYIVSHMCLVSDTYFAAALSAHCICCCICWCLSLPLCLRGFGRMFCGPFLDKGKRTDKQKLTHRHTLGGFDNPLYQVHLILNIYFLPGLLLHWCTVCFVLCLSSTVWGLCYILAFTRYQVYLYEPKHK